MSQTETNPRYVQRACHDCKKQYITTIIKIGESFIPKNCRCPPCQFAYNEYRQEEAWQEAYEEARFWQRVRDGEIDEEGNELD